MLIFGFRTRFRTVDSGVFRCPNEAVDRHYEYKQARRWFTLFFIPVIPLKQQGEWVQCQGCGTQYHSDVLQRHASRPAT